MSPGELKDGLEYDAQDTLVKPALGSGPGVLVVHSGRGVTEFVGSLCQRLARQGFVALAVDLFDGETPDTTEEARSAKDQLDRQDAMRVLEDSVAFLQEHEAVSRQQVGVLGLGYGGEWACCLGESLPRDIGGIVLFYGYKDVDWSVVEAPVLGHFAELDRELPPSEVEDLRETLTSVAVPTDFFVYSGVEPSFFEDEENAQYSPEAARLAWERTATFFDRTLRENP